MKKGQQAFKIRRVNLKSKSSKMSLKRTPTGPKTTTRTFIYFLHLQLQKVSTKTTIFIATKQEQTNLAVIQI